MLIAILNVLLCCAVLVMVVSPLVWAILTQRRDHLAAGRAASDARPPKAQPSRSTRRRRHSIPSAAG